MDVRRVYDCVIVGAGVAGLMAAHALLRSRPGASALLVDAGLPLERRALTASATGGYGGAGLFLGGRLYLGAASLPVAAPVTTPAQLRPVISGEEYLRRANEVDGLLQDLGARAEWQPQPPEPLARAIERAAAVGIEYVASYPSRRLSLDDKQVALGALQGRLTAAGVRFLMQAQVAAVTREGEGYALTLRAVPAADDDAPPVVPAQVLARTLLLAPGRYGTEWLRQIASALDAEVTPLPTTFGVRLEVPAAVYDPLTDVNPDPRLQMTVAGDALLKTYATCPGGVVAPVMRYGALVASGVPQLARERRGPTTTVAILAQPGVEGARGAWRGGEECAPLLNQRQPGRLIVQRLGDARRREATSAAGLTANSVQPSDATAQPGALHDAYPAAYWEAFEPFLGRLDALAPGVSHDDMLLYGPAEERFWGFPTDEGLQTTAPGLFVAGDGAGQSQGIIQASVAGLLAGEGMARALASETPRRAR